MHYIKILFIYSLIFSYSAMNICAKNNIIDSNNNKLEIEADELNYDKKNDTIKASGNVFLKQGDLKLVSESIIYDNKNGYLYANGNISFTTDTKNIFFGKYAFFDRNKDEGIILNFTARINKKGLLSSNAAELIDKKTFLVHDIVFSTCKICKDNLIPHIPLWQIKSKTAKIKQKEDKVEFKDATIEFFGKPIFYTPYLAIPTPKAKRKSGFLAPKFKNSNVLGFQLSLPYYFNISPNMDLIYTPEFISKKGVLNSFEFRHLARYGSYNINGNLLYKDKIKDDKMIESKKIRYYLNSHGNFKFSKNYFFDYKFKRLFDTNRNFLKEYDINKDDMLISKTTFRNEQKNQLITIDGLFFQDLRKKTYEKGATPHVFPRIRTYNAIDIDNSIVSKFVIRSELINLRRKEGGNYRRGVFQTDLIKFLNFDSGQIVEIAPSLTYNHYKTNNIHNKESNHVTGNLLVGWRWPFIKHFKLQNIILEPIINLNLNYTKYKNFSNDDLNENAISMPNILSSNSLIKNDKINEGTKMILGIKANYNSNEKIFGAILAHSYQLRDAIKNNNISYTWNDNEPSKKRKIIGKLYGQMDANTAFVNNFSLDPNGLNLIKNEIETQINFKKFEINLNHVFINKRFINNKFNDYNQEISATLKYNFKDNWWIKTKGKRKIGSLLTNNNDNQKRWVNHEISLLYKEDCININFGVKKEYNRPLGLKNAVITFLKIEPVF
ncbi:MAG: LPS-assembly protein [Candidatus Midichloriaceae bacterium]|jgi:LPS-assembly protein